MERITWSNRRWLCQERWGLIHPSKSWNWYDSSCVGVNEADTLFLNIKPNSRIFVINNSIVESKYGTGLVSSEEDFGFGKFEIEAKLPVGKGLWPAFWLYASNAWPPEIDIFEGYSGKDGDYRGNWFKPIKVQSCFHKRDDWNCNKSTPAMSPWRCQFNERPDMSFNTYSCEWTKDKIEFFINSKRIRKIDDKCIMKNLLEYKMRVIINNHIDGNFVERFTSETPFTVKRFSYEKI